MRTACFSEYLGGGSVWTDSLPWTDTLPWADTPLCPITCWDTHPPPWAEQTRANVKFKSLLLITIMATLCMLCIDERPWSLNLHFPCSGQKSLLFKNFISEFIDCRRRKQHFVSGKTKPSFFSFETQT